MFRKYGKPILAILALCLLCAGCQLAKPELGETQAAPVGIWLEAHAQPPAQDYVPTVDYDAPGALGLVMLTERVDMRQTFQNVPNITYEAVKRLLS